MITVRDYALNKGVTERAVYKQMKSKKNAERLDGHIQIIDGKQWLDDTAVSILDESKKTAVVIAHGNNDQHIKELEQEIKDLNKELKVAYQEIAKQAPALAEAAANKLLLEEKRKDIAKEKERVDALYRENLELKVKLDQEEHRRLSFKERLFGHK